MHHVAGRLARPKGQHGAHDGLLIKTGDGRNSPVVAGRIVTRRAGRRDLGALIGAPLFTESHGGGMGGMY